MTSSSQSPFACNMDSIHQSKRDVHLATTTQVFQTVKDIRELPDGYAFTLPPDEHLLLKAAEFISLERLCCPFFGFSLEIEPEGGAVHLQLTGREGLSRSSELSLASI